MAIVRYATDVKNAVLTALKDQLDLGSGPAYMELYTSPQPATPADAVTSQTKLGTLTFSDPSGTVTAGELTCAPSPGITQDASADADGTAVWARVYDSTGLAKFDCNVTNTGGGGALQLNSVAIKAGGPIIATSFKFYLP